MYSLEHSFHDIRCFVSYVYNLDIIIHHVRLCVYFFSIIGNGNLAKSDDDG